MPVKIPRYLVKYPKGLLHMFLGRWFAAAATASLLVIGGYHRAALAVRPMEGRALARHSHYRKAAQWRVVADHARWQRRGDRAGAAWRRTLFLVCRGRDPGHP